MSLQKDATEGDVTREKWSETCKFAGLKMKEGGHQLRIVSSFEKLEKSRKQISPRDSKKQCNPANTLTITQ